MGDFVIGEMCDKEIHARFFKVKTYLLIFCKSILKSLLVENIVTFAKVEIWLYT